MRVWASVIGLAAGYLLGSVSPAYILGRILKRIDIRQVGTRNAGTMNVYQTLGLGPAIITAIYDLGKGLLAMALSQRLGASPLFVHLAGPAAVLGHVFPFYLRFRGGEGVATSVAILIYELALFIVKGWLAYPSLILLAFTTLSFLAITRSGALVGLVDLPFLTFILIAYSPFSLDLVFLLVFIAYILFIDIRNLWREKRLAALYGRLADEIRWRLCARPLAFLFIIYYLKTSLKPALTLIGVVVLFFLLVDLIRLLTTRVSLSLMQKLAPVTDKIFKKKESRTFSSMTTFLIAFFLTVLLFEKCTAILACAYLVFGDFFSKSFGLAFGRRKLFEKTLEGSLAHFIACSLAGYILLAFLPYPLLNALLGALVASLVEALPLSIDDNLTVPIISASAMSVLFIF